jgi:hypothetical protein
LTTQNKLRARFAPGDTFSWAAMEKVAIDTFVKETRSETFIGMGKEFQTSAWVQVAKCYSSSIAAFTEHYNWQTEFGKAFCSELRKQLGLAPDSMQKNEDGSWTVLAMDPKDRAAPFFLFPTFPEAACKKHKVLHHGEWSAYVPSANTTQMALRVASVHGDAKAQDVDMKEAESKADVKMHEDNARPLCVICEDKPADTLVMPCGHVIVCSSCSVDLRKTENAKQCVYCRRAVEEIVYP